MIGYHRAMRLIAAASLGSGFKYTGNFGTADAIDQYVFIRDKDTGLPIAGVTDLTATVKNPNGTTLLDSPFPLFEVPGVAGLYKFTILPSQRSQIGYYAWSVSSPTINADQPIVGGFIASLVMSGAGNREVTIAVVDQETTGPIADVGVYVRDATGTTILAAGTTDGAGQVVLNLWDGEYQVYLSKMGNYRFTVPEDLTVDGDTEVEYQGVSIIPSPPPDPAMCVIYGWLYELNASPYALQKFHVSIYQPPRGSRTGVLLGSGALEVSTDVEGYFSFYAIRGYMIRIDVPQASLEAAVLVPDQDSIKITDLVKLG